MNQFIVMDLQFSISCNKHVDGISSVALLFIVMDLQFNISCNKKVNGICSVTLPGQLAKIGPY